MTVNAILVLSALGMETALRIKAGLPGATIYGFEGRVEGADVSFSNFGETIRERYQSGHDDHRTLCRRHHYPLTGLGSW